MADNKPIVALESTIISHGMPYPSNYNMALEVEEVIRAGGAVPATIAILHGQIHVGTSREALHLLAERGQRVRKTASRDLPLLLSSQQDGATTVSSTMKIASMAGIRVFVTGGIGGVHRGAETTGDVSADLTELASSPVAVVCAGAKSILDIPRTLEFLETFSVPVMSYQSDSFPAFFTRSSGCPSQIRVDTPEHVAQIISNMSRLGMKGGAVLGVPIPEESAAEGEQVEKAIHKALMEAQEQRVEGNRVTPFLLKRINELTQGESLRANVALVKNNAKIGASVAVALMNMGAYSEGR
ncbi:hypothetical protein GUITHDRAFT_158632 [Guillardia theta CCMP2712]|uniref:Pseudouridine-5'-phosphate glycosidase n=1 Tax=Guillardia theta (strain CCMP2712) TaxID=905079 RepID=L1IL63_GUITC|nr:hypothetical protein GUITHDRAFT_158632 [Guillardia theta CCMP2712]EKX36981.1 hypothetical protein GUITHDRAFT_158632 [Guillardia theta CCMP2712]|eukprot:XP_005823961.1 hypothetical protein GUITHDRAFT_158632 [Guillardia theta CCMP2712]